MLADQPIYSIIDLETTGFGPSAGIIEVAILTVVEEAITSRFDSLVNPEMHLWGEEIHGIHDYHIRDAPKLPEIIGDIGRKLDGTILVAHNLPFDVKLLTRAFELEDVLFDPGRGHCTYAQSGMKLDRAFAFLEGHPPEIYHRAMADAESCFRVFRECSKRARLTPASVDSLPDSKAAPFRREDYRRKINPLVFQFVFSDEDSNDGDLDETESDRSLEWPQLDVGYEDDDGKLHDSKPEGCTDRDPKNRFKLFKND